MRAFRKRREVTIDMIEGPLFPNVINFAIPLMVTNFLQVMFNAADTIVAGKYAGEAALAAVGATGSLCYLLTALFNGLAVGTNVVIASLYGSRKTSEIKKAVHTSIWLAIVSGLALTFFGLATSKVLLEIMLTPEDIIDLASLYMRIYFIGVLPSLIYNFGSAILRSKGDTKRPLYFMIVSGILNLVLNMVFVIVFDMSVAGVGIATVISETLSAFLVWKTLSKSNDETALNIREVSFNKDIALEIIRIGVPAGIQGMVFALSNVVIQSSINSFNSSSIVAGNSAGANVEGFVYIGMQAFSQATITFTSQNIGAGRKERIKDIMLVTLVLDSLSALLMGFLAWYFGPLLLSFDTDEQAVIDIGMIRLFYIALFLILNGILDVFVNSMRGMGYSTLPTILMILGICGTRLLWIAKVFPMYQTLESIYICYPVSWTITLLIQLVLWIIYHHKKIKEA